MQDHRGLEFGKVCSSSIYTLLTFKMDSKPLWHGREWHEAEKARDGITFVGEREGK